MTRLFMMLFNRLLRKTINILLAKFVYRIWNLIYELFHDDYMMLTASVTPLNHNWGDDVSEKLVELITQGKKVIISKYSYNIKKKDEYSCIGSIITWMTTSRSVIWGSGVVYPNSPLSDIPKKVLAVRGPLTRKYLVGKRIDCPEIYGDPALLFPRYYMPKNLNKKYKLGIIPHFRDQDNPILHELEKMSDVLIIDVKNIHPWFLFINQIVQCEHIISSSLHGLIIADAYQVPNLWIEFDGGEKKKFAFHDYLMSVGHDVSNPYQLTQQFDIDQIISLCKWQPLDIDLDLLMSVCPFKC